MFFGALNYFPQKEIAIRCAIVMTVKQSEVKLLKSVCVFQCVL